MFASTRLRSLGDSYNEWIERHEIAWELVMAALAVLFVIVGIVDGSLPEGSPDAPLIDKIDLALTIVFVVEFTSRFAAPHSRKAYLRGHWIDAIAMIPVTRSLRLLRLVRLMRLFRAFAGIYRALSSLERFAAHRGLILLFSAWLSVAVISGAAFFLAEVEQNPNIHSPVDALWWAIVTLTTVGYGDISPVTAEGRLAASVLMIVGITLWAAITGTITSLLVESRSAGAGIPEQIRQLDELRRDEILSVGEFESKKVELLARM